MIKADLCACPLHTESDKSRHKSEMTLSANRVDLVLSTTTMFDTATATRFGWKKTSVAKYAALASPTVGPRNPAGR